MTFYINANFCILNRPNLLSNDLKSISVKRTFCGYCLSNFDFFSSKFSDFEIMCTSVVQSGHASMLAPTNIPDHSVLSLNINLEPCHYKSTLIQMY